MAAGFALGAEAVQMGTRMVSSTESPVHENWKNAIARKPIRCFLIGRIRQLASDSY